VLLLTVFYVLCSILQTAVGLLTLNRSGPQGHDVVRHSEFIAIIVLFALLFDRGAAFRQLPDLLLERRVENTTATPLLPLNLSLPRFFVVTH
jgi:hypothetical protein